MDVEMLALADRLNHLADVDAVLDDGVAGLVVAQRDLVPDRNVALRGDDDVLVVFHDPAGQGLPGFHAFDDDHADAVAFFVDNEMNHGALFYSDVHSTTFSARRWRTRRRLRVAGVGGISLFARRGIGLSDAERRRPVDAPWRNSRAGR